MTLTDAIKRCRNLLALAKGNTNENEMKAALATADRIMQEYRITQAQVEAQDVAQAEPMVRKEVAKGGRRTAWREVLLHAITSHYGCAWYLWSHRSGGFNYNDSGTLQGRKGSKGTTEYTVVGREGDVAIVEYMFSHLTGEVERLCRWHAGGKGVKFAVAWMMGCAEGIAHQFYDMRVRARAQAQENASANTCAALVLLDKRNDAAKEYMNTHCGVSTKAARSIGGAQDYNARHEGFKEGKKVQIAEGLPQGAQAPKMGA